MDETASESELESLKQRVAELERELDQLKAEKPQRVKIEKMSAEVVDSNPYRYINSAQLLFQKWRVLSGSKMYSLSC